MEHKKTSHHLPENSDRYIRPNLFKGKSVWTARQYDLRGSQDEKFNSLDIENRDVRVQIGDLSNIGKTKVSKFSNRFHSQNSDVGEKNTTQTSPSLECKSCYFPAEQTLFPRTESFVCEQLDSSYEHHNQEYAQQKKILQNKLVDNKFNSKIGKSTYHQIIEQQTLKNDNLANSADEDKKSCNRREELKQRSVSAPTQPISMSKVKPISTKALKTQRQRTNDSINWLTDKGSPVKVSSFLSAGHGVTQEYMFSHNQRSNAKAITMSELGYSLGSLNSDGNSDFLIDNDLVSSERAFDSTFANGEVSLRCESQISDSKRILPPRTLNKRKSLSAPTSPSFGRKPALIDRFYRNNKMAKSGGSSPVRSDSTDSITSLACKALQVQFPLIMANGSPDVEEGLEEELSSDEDDETRYATPVIKFVRYNESKHSDRTTTESRIKDTGYKATKQWQRNIQKCETGR